MPQSKFTPANKSVLLLSSLSLLLTWPITPMALPNFDFASSWEVEANIAYEAKVYQQKGDQVRDRDNQSLIFNSEFYTTWNDGADSLTIEPVYRFDQQDNRRSNFDFIEFVWTHVGENYESKLGISKVFWGVTESQHLVDIINQTDLADNIDGEGKLGQPMFSLAFEDDWGNLDLYFLTGFRERTFAGQDGRLRGPLVVNEDAPLFESGAKRRRLDVALRWSFSLSDWDIAVSHFSGTSREPDLLIDLSSVAQLRPFYPVIDQTGIELQYIYNDTIWKLEGFSRSGQGSRFAAITAGFESTFIGVLNSRANVGLVMEYLYDERQEAAPVGVFEQDLFVGTRIALNDTAGSTALIGMFWDPETEEQIFRIEGQRRLTDQWTININANILRADDINASNLNNVLQNLQLLDPNNKLGFISQDDYIQIELVRFF